MAEHDELLAEAEGVDWRGWAPSVDLVRRLAAALSEADAENARLRTKLWEARHDRDVAREEWGRLIADGSRLQAKLDAVKAALSAPVDYSKVLDNHHGNALWGAHKATRALAILNGEEPNNDR